MPRRSRAKSSFEILTTSRRQDSSGAWEVIDGSYTVTVDMGKFQAELMDAQLDHHTTAVRAGLSPETGQPQKALSPELMERAIAGKRSEHRGLGQKYKFAGSYRSRASKGVTQSTGTIGANPFFDQWQIIEQSRGVEYYAITGKADEVTDQVIALHLEWMGVE